MRVIDRPDCELAHAFEALTCDDPKCGLHLIPQRQDGSPICEMIIGRDSLRSMGQYILDNGLDLS